MSKVIDLPRAAVDIVRTYWKRTKGGQFVSPFFLLTGAGVSNPPLPSASQVVQLCRERMEQRGLPLPLQTGSPARQYFEHLDLAFSSPEERREFLGGLFEGFAPSRANQLAARLTHPKDGLTDLLATTNLDDMGEKSLRALGLNPDVLDHPSEIIQRLQVLGSSGVQVLHLHGTCAHSDFCNLLDEIRLRARKLRPALQALLYSRSPLVAGYSGWEEDAFMKALRARLREAEGTMVGELYWFCYTQDDVEALPGWLKKDPRVRIVAPSSNGSDQGRLPAERVFETLLEARAAEKPAELRAPRRPRRPASASTTPSVVIAAADGAVDRGDFREALIQLRQLSPGTLTAGLRSYYDTTLEKLYLGARDTAPDLGMEACLLRRTAIMLGLGADKTSLGTDLGARMRLGRAVYGEGVCLVGLGKHVEALLRFDETLALTATGKDGLRGRAAHALNGRAVALYSAGRTAEAQQTWEELLRIEPEADAEVAEALALGRFNLKLASFKLGRTEAVGVGTRAFDGVRDVALVSAGFAAEGSVRDRGGLAATRQRGCRATGHIRELATTALVRTLVKHAEDSLRLIAAEEFAADFPTNYTELPLDEDTPFERIHLSRDFARDTDFFPVYDFDAAEAREVASAAVSPFSEWAAILRQRLRRNVAGASLDARRVTLGVTNIKLAALACDLRREGALLDRSGYTRVDAGLSERTIVVSTSAEPTVNNPESALEQLSTTPTPATGDAPRALAWRVTDAHPRPRRERLGRRRAGFARPVAAAA